MPVRKKGGLGILPSVLAACALALMAKLFVVDAAFVSGPSMEPTLRAGSVVVYLKAAYGLSFPLLGRVSWARPSAGDIVVATSPGDGGAIVVKRVVAVGPATLEMDAGNAVLPDGSRLPWAGRADPPPGPIELAEDQVFLAGDNPAQSLDSRDYGPLPVEALSGRVLSCP